MRLKYRLLNEAQTVRVTTSFLSGFLIATTTAGWASAQDPFVPPHSVELEPHLAVAPYDPPGDSEGNGFGAGIRITIPIFKEGFSDRIDDLFGIGFGFDYLYHDDEEIIAGGCSRFTTAPNGQRICTQVGDRPGGDAHYLYFPVVASYSLWPIKQFSLVFDAGILIYAQKQDRDTWDVSPWPTFSMGGRYHLNDTVAFTLKLGYPAITAGAAFYF